MSLGVTIGTMRSGVVFEFERPAVHGSETRCCSHSDRTYVHREERRSSPFDVLEFQKQGSRDERPKFTEADQLDEPIAGAPPPVAIRPIIVDGAYNP